MDGMQGSFNTGFSSRQTNDGWVCNGLMSAEYGKRIDVKSDESRLNLLGHDGRIRVRRYVDERCLPECFIEQHSGLTP
ncbi:hypothetical protein TNCV_3624451 [Trichonephila clavipes]|nr:hypothetical protein TNCV_3624451 [Trichonephila clavipes]